MTKQQQLVSALKRLLSKDVEDGLLSSFFFLATKKKREKSRATALVWSCGYSGTKPIQDTCIPIYPSHITIMLPHFYVPTKFTTSTSGASAFESLDRERQLYEETLLSRCDYHPIQIRPAEFTSSAEASHLILFPWDSSFPACGHALYHSRWGLVLAETLSVQWATYSSGRCGSLVIHAYIHGCVHLCITVWHIPRDQTHYLRYGCQPVSGVMLPGLKLVQYLNILATKCLDCDFT